MSQAHRAPSGPALQLSFEPGLGAFGSGVVFLRPAAGPMLAALEAIAEECGRAMERAGVASHTVEGAAAASGQDVSLAKLTALQGAGRLRCEGAKAGKPWRAHATVAKMSKWRAPRGAPRSRRPRGTRCRASPRRTP